MSESESEGTYQWQSGALAGRVKPTRRDVFDASPTQSTDPSQTFFGHEVAEAVRELEDESHKTELEVFQKQDAELERLELARARALRSLKTLSAKFLGQRIQLQTAVCGPLFGLLPPINSLAWDSSEAVEELQIAISNCENQLKAILKSFVGEAELSTLAPIDCPSDAEWDPKDSAALQDALTSQISGVAPATWSVNPSSVSKEAHSADIRHVGLAFRRYRKTTFSQRDAQWATEDRLWQQVKRRRVCEAMDQIRVQIATEDYAVLNKQVTKQTEEFMRGLDFCRSFASSQTQWKPTDGYGQEVIGQTTVYDDAEYYAFLLRRFVRGDETTKPASTPSVHINQRRTPSVRTKEERKLSKGRRLKFESIPELKGFMIPTETPDRHSERPPGRLMRTAVQTLT